MFKEDVNNLMTSLSLSLDQYGPEIGFWAGLGLMLGGGVWAVVRSLKKVPEIKDEYQKSNMKVAVKRASGVLDEDEADAAEKEIKKRRNREYVKAYAGPVLLEAAGIALEVVTHVEMNNRYELVSGELLATTAAFSSYRKRNAALIGEEQERALYYNKELKSITVEDKDADGNVVGTHEEYYLEDNGQEDVPHDPYTYEYSPETTGLCEPFDDMHEFNLATLAKRQAEWDNILKMSPAVFLNDVLRALGLPEESLASRHAGWLNPKYYKTPGDGYIDFRVTPVRYQAPDGHMRWKYMLNFNCDGNISEIIKDQVGLFGVASRQIDTIEVKEN